MNTRISIGIVAALMLAIGTYVVVWGREPASIAETETATDTSLAAVTATTSVPDSSMPMPTTTLPAPTPEPELAGITMAEVARHDSKVSCWTVIKGSVYDVTSYISKHPGGASRILSLCGKDGTTAFEGQHDGDRRPESTLATFKIGALSTN